MATPNVMIEKLHGRENFLDWKFAVKTLLELEGLWKAVLDTEDDAEKKNKSASKNYFAY